MDVYYFDTHAYKSGQQFLFTIRKQCFASNRSDQIRMEIFHCSNSYTTYFSAIQQGIPTRLDFVYSKTARKLDTTMNHTKVISLKNVINLKKTITKPIQKTDITCWTPIIKAKSSVGFHRPRSFVLNWFSCAFFFLLFEEPEGLEWLLFLESIGVGVDGARVGCITCPAANISEYGLEYDCVRILFSAFGTDAPGNPKLYSTSSSSKRRRFIDLDELESWMV